MICPRCEAQRYDVGSCATCGNIGYLTEDAEQIDTPRKLLDTYLADAEFRTALDEELKLVRAGVCEV